MLNLITQGGTGDNKTNYKNNVPSLMELVHSGDAHYKVISKPRHSVRIKDFKTSHETCDNRPLYGCHCHLLTTNPHFLTVGELFHSVCKSDI